MLALRALLATQPPLELGPKVAAKFDALLEQTPAAKGVTYHQAVVGGVPGWWCRLEGAAEDVAILHLHGGGYVVGSAKSYRKFVGQIAERAKANIFIADYRLAPDHPFPAAIEDAEAAYRGLVETGCRRIALTGDSAGGGIALGLLARLAAADQASLPRPLATAVMSPWTDLALTGASFQTRARADPLLRRDTLERAASLYLGDRDPRSPAASPLYGDVTGLSPVLIQVGQDEVLLDDARRYAARVEAAGGTVELHVWDGMVHVFQTNITMLRAARDAMDQTGDFLRRTLSAPRAAR